MSQPQRVMTAYGPGVVVATETVRGATQYKVEGEGFSVWLTAAQVPEFGQLEWDQSEDHTWDNSTTLPYNPSPQFPARGTGESTIQPNQHVDPDKRLSPADSVDFRGGGEPARDMSHLFARTAAQSIDELSPELRQTVEFAHQHAYDWALDQGYGFDDAEDYASWFARYVMSIEEMPEYGHDSMSRDWAAERGGDPRYASRRTAAWTQEYDGTWYTNYPSGAGGKAIPFSESGEDSWWVSVEGPDGNMLYEEQGVPLEQGMAAADAAAGGVTAARHPELSLEDVQAKLGDKYVAIPVDVDHSSLQARLDNDPYRTVADIRMSHFEQRGELDPKLGKTWDLMDADESIHTAAWADVRKKALRLRKNGYVQLEAANPSAIVATVTGDHGIYEVAVLRGNVLTGSSAVTEWSCSCPWGDWAFERQRTYVGRLCSHAYAALLELQSLTKRKEKPYGWSGTAARYPREDGRLSTEPGTLTPDLHYIPKQRRLDRIDVTAGHELEANAFDDYMDFVGEGQYASDQEAFEDYRNYREMSGRPVTQDEIDELNRVGVEVTAGHELEADGVDAAGAAAEWAEQIGYNDPWDFADWVMSTGRGATHLRYEDYEDLFAEYQNGERQASREAFLSEPFEGSGPDQPDSYSSSEDYVEYMDGNGQHYHTDVDGPGDNPAVQNGDDVMPPATRGASNEDLRKLPPLHQDLGYIADYYGEESKAVDKALGKDAASETPEQVRARLEAEEFGHAASVVEHPESGEDVEHIDVEDPEAFAKTGSQDNPLAYLMQGNGEPVGGQFDFTAAAQAHLRTAGRQFTFAEQQALIDELAPDGPIDQNELDLTGTHYLG